MSSDKDFKTWKVGVEKRLYATGAVKIEARTAEEAERKVRDNIFFGKLQTTEVNWEDPQYEAFSFDVVGDTEEITGDIN